MDLCYHAYNAKPTVFLFVIALSLFMLYYSTCVFVVCCVYGPPCMYVLVVFFLFLYGFFGCYGECLHMFDISDYYLPSLGELYFLWSFVVDMTALHCHCIPGFIAHHLCIAQLLYTL